MLAVAGFAVLAGAAATLWDGPHWSDWPVLALGAFVAGDTLACIVVSVMLLAAVPFGWDGPFLSVFASCSAEAAPPGQATILQLEPFARTENKGLAHSGLHQSDLVISRIVTLICGPPPARAPAF